MEKIVQGLKDLEKPPTQTEIQQKLTRLRCYYTAENNKVEKSKVSGTDRDSVYEPTWIFFDSLEFLRDNLVIRSTKSNLEADKNEEPASTVYNVSNPPSSKSVRKMKKVQQTSAENVMASASRALEKIESRYSQIEVEKPKKSTENEDRNLGRLRHIFLPSHIVLK